MQEADLTATRQAEWLQQQGAGAGNSRFLMDDKLVVTFSRDPRLNLRESNKQNRPVFEEAEYVEIRIPGNSSNIIKRPVSAMDRRRFASRYEKWAETGKNADEGTSLEAIKLTKSHIAELAYFGIKTVEQLAGLTDANAQNFMGINALKQKAQAFLDEVDGAVSRSEMKAELDELRAQLADITTKATTAPRTTNRGRKVQDSKRAA